MVRPLLLLITLVSLFGCGQDDLFVFGNGAKAEGKKSVAAAISRIDKKRYIENLTIIARPRPPHSEHWQLVQNLCAEVFWSAGLTVELQPFVQGERAGVNVVGVRKGTQLDPEELVIIGAHYDHIAECDGADDNATGVAGLFETLHAIAGIETRRTLVAACWDQEEGSLDGSVTARIGSRAYVHQAISRGEAIAGALNYDMIGYTAERQRWQRRRKNPPYLDGRAPLDVTPQSFWNVVDQGNFDSGDFLLVEGVSASAQLVSTIEAEAKSIGLRVLSFISDDGHFSNSDQRSFWEKAIPAVFLGDTGPHRNPNNYHCLNDMDSFWTDSVETLNHDFAVKVIKAGVAGLLTMLQ